MSVFQHRSSAARWTPLRWTAPPAFILALLVIFGFFLYMFTATSFGIVAGLGALAVVFVVAIWVWPHAGLWLLVVGGALHPFLMLLLFNITGAGAALKAAQSWKEIIVLVVLLKVVHLALVARRPIRVTPLDFLVLAFLLLGLLYLGHPGTVHNEDLPLPSRIFGLRADGFFFLAYFIGRGLGVNLRTVKALVVSFLVVSFLLALVTPFQFMAPGMTNAVFDQLGFSDYLGAQRGDNNEYYAIRQNEIPGMYIPRASSLLLSDLALAFYMLLAVPLSAAVFIMFRKPLARVTMNLLVLANIMALALSVTRTAMLASVPMLLVMFARERALFLGLLLAVQLGVGAVLAANAAGIGLDTLGEVFSTQDQSVQAHMRALEESAEVLQQYPVGRGLGTAGQIAQRFGAAGGITNESWYFQIATELGVLGMLIWVAITVTVPMVMFVRYRQAQSPWLKALALGIGCSMIGYAFASITLHAWEGLTSSIIFWLFAGIAVSAPDLERRWQAEAAPARSRGRS